MNNNNNNKTLQCGRLPAILHQVFFHIPDRSGFIPTALQYFLFYTMISKPQSVLYRPLAKDGCYIFRLQK